MAGQRQNVTGTRLLEAEDGTCGIDFVNYLHCSSLEEKRGVEAELVVSLNCHGVAGVGGTTVGLRQEPAVVSRSVSLAWRGGKKRGSKRGKAEAITITWLRLLWSKAKRRG
jgi:hypothetical protein